MLSCNLNPKTSLRVHSRQHGRIGSQNRNWPLHFEEFGRRQSRSGGTTSDSGANLEGRLRCTRSIVGYDRSNGTDSKRGEATKKGFIAGSFLPVNSIVHRDITRAV